jgi:hypothetical protein
MESILKEIDKVRLKLRRGATDTLLLKKPFAEGMYRFSMFMISYYSRVRQDLKIDYDSFMIVQTVVSNKLYSLSKKKGLFSSSYKELETAWESGRQNKDTVINVVSNTASSRLTVSSICLVTGQPKETVRRKVQELTIKKILINSKKEGIMLGDSYKKIFQDFVPDTTKEVSKLLKKWEKSGVLKNLLNFKI